MDRDQETTFIHSLIQRGRRERAQCELLSEKKRRQFINRLCHDYDKVLDDRCLLPISRPNSDCGTIRELLKRDGASDTCYAISATDGLDGKTLPLSAALEKAVGFGQPTILLRIPGKLAYFEAEQTAGPSPRYLLSKR